MAKHYGKQSKYLKKQVQLQQGWQFVLIFWLGLSLGYLLKSITTDASNSITTLIGLFITMLIITLMLGGLASRFFVNSKIEEIKLTKGLKGEGKTYFALQKLPKDYSVFQDLVIQELGNIDFVVTGPTGVFVIEVKNISGKITTNEDSSMLLVNGKEVDFNPLNQTYRNTKVLEKYIAHKPILVVVLAGKVDIKFGHKPIKGVYVIGLDWLKKLIRGFNESISENDLQKVNSNILNLILK